MIREFQGSMSDLARVAAGRLMGYLGRKLVGQLEEYLLVVVRLLIFLDG